MALNRQEQIVEELKVSADNHVLEIGCGHGVAATALCSKLRNGKYVGIDRSRTMIEAASKRNKAYINDGTASFLVQNLEDLELGDQKFDIILAVRVRLFYKDPERAKRIVSKYLAPGGKIISIYDLPV